MDHVSEQKGQKVKIGQKVKGQKVEIGQKVEGRLDSSL